MLSSYRLMLLHFIISIHVQCDIALANIYGWANRIASSWESGLYRPAVLSVSEAFCDPLHVPAVFACWQQRQAGKMGARRDDMWQRLHARLAGTRQACESSGLLQHCQTLLFIALGVAPENKKKKKIITTTVTLGYAWEDSTFWPFDNFDKLSFLLLQ